MDLDLSTYVYNYDKEKNLSLDHNFFEVIAEESYKDLRKCDGPMDRWTCPQSKIHLLFTVSSSDENFFIL